MMGDNTPHELIAIEPEIEGGGSSWWYVCGECHGAVDLMAEKCPHCCYPLRKNSRKRAGGRNRRSMLRTAAGVAAAALICDAVS